MLLQGDQRSPLWQSPLQQRLYVKEAYVIIYFPSVPANLYASDAVKSCCKKL